jgi:Flp pilus assembly protein TadG
MKRWRQRFGSTEGSEIAEMAMVLPVMFFVFLGIFWVGRMYNIYATVNQAARAGARVAAQSACVTCSASTATVDDAVKTVLQADHLDPTKITAPNPAPSVTNCLPLTAVCTPTTTYNVTVCQNVLLSAATVSPQECGVLVEFTYHLDLRQIAIPWAGVLPSPQIAARAQMRVEQ